MATLQQAADKKKELSSQISTLIRTLCLSVLAVAWIFLSRNKEVSALIAVVPQSHMMFIAALCITAIAFDLIQYIAGYIQVSRDYGKAKSLNSPSAIVEYTKSPLREFSFYTKIILTILVAIWLVIMLFWAMAVAKPSVGLENSSDSSNVTVVVGR